MKSVQSHEGEFCQELEFENVKKMFFSETLRDLFSHVNETDEEATTKRYSYLDLFTKNKAMAKHTIVLSFIW